MATVLTTPNALVDHALASGGETVRYICAHEPLSIAVTLNDSEGVVLFVESEQLFLDAVAPGLFAVALGDTTWQVGVDDAGVRYWLNDDDPTPCVRDAAFADTQKDGQGQPSSQDYVSVFGNYSLGGRVRSGPGTHDDILDLLPEGEPVALVARTGVFLDGYEWFEIEYSEGLRGYQWGGIMCSNAPHITGLYDPCPPGVGQ